MPPKDLFGDREKQKSRLDIWNELSSFRSVRVANILILPGSSRHELNVLIDLGYVPSNIYLVEKNPATLANLTRRCKNLPTPPRRNIFRMYLSEAATKIAERGIRLDVAHLDFCQNVDSEKTMIDEARQFIRSRVMADHSLLAITWQRGRENEIDRLASLGITVHAVSYGSSPAAQSFQAMSIQDRGRLRKVYETFDTNVWIRKIGSYQNRVSRTHMSWAIFELQKASTQPEPEIESPRFRSKHKTWR